MGLGLLLIYCLTDGPRSVVSFQHGGNGDAPMGDWPMPDVGKQSDGHVTAVIRTAMHLYSPLVTVVLAIVVHTVSVPFFCCV